MNNKQKLHQIKLTQWASRFHEQAASGLTVKAWCAENNVTIHTYNYWKHKLKLEYVDSLLPEYSCAMKSHFRKSGNQMSGKWKSSYASLLA